MHSEPTNAALCADDMRLFIPPSPTDDGPVDDEIIARFEGTLAEWTSIMQAALARETTKKMDAKGTVPPEHLAGTMPCTKLGGKITAPERILVPQNAEAAAMPHPLARPATCVKGAAK